MRVGPNNNEAVFAIHALVTRADTQGIQLAALPPDNYPYRILGAVVNGLEDSDAGNSAEIWIGLDNMSSGYGLLDVKANGVGTHLVGGQWNVREWDDGLPLWVSYHEAGAPSTQGGPWTVTVFLSIPRTVTG